jgi:uncharacterized protein YndB with AHSA1/START domain
MQRVERKASVAAAPETVFAYLAELDNLPAWQAGVLEAHRTSEGPMGVGTTAQVVRQLMGQRIAAPLTVTAYDPPRRVVVESTVSGVSVSIALDIAPAEVNGGAELTVVAEIRGSGLTGFMEPMIASAAGSDLATSLERLRVIFAADG